MGGSVFEGSRALEVLKVQDSFPTLKPETLNLSLNPEPQI